MLPSTKKVALVRKYNRSISNLKKEVTQAGFQYVTQKPDFVISVGGDGTFFFAERKYPGVPKIMVRESQVCEKCNEGTLNELLIRYRKGFFKIKEYFKLESVVKRKKGASFRVIAANDVILRNKVLTRALRFSVSINNKIVDSEVIGDGIVFSSPFGATAYFKSITRQTFTRGIGIAFNNTTKLLNNIIVKENAKIKITLLRENADLGFDNDPKTYTLHEGDTIMIQKSKKVSRIISIIC